MSKIFKRLISCMVVLAVVIGCGFVFTACGKDNKEEKVMNVSLNPSVEFILDEDNKVETVSATNDDGNFIITLEGANFVGKTAEDAAKLFIQLAKENGFIDANATAEDNKFTVEISGETAQKLYDSVKKNVNSYLSSVNVSNVSISFNKIDLAELKEELAHCRQDLTQTQIASLSEEDVVEMLEDIREETETFVSQELKELYYFKRAFEETKAWFQQIKDKMDELNSGALQGMEGFEFSNFAQHFPELSGTVSWDDVYELFEEKFNDYSLKMTQIIDEFTEELLSETSSFQIAMSEYIEAKKAVLEARVKGEAVSAQDQIAYTSAQIALYGIDGKDDGVGGLKDLVLAEIKTMTIALNISIDTVKLFANLSFVNFNTTDIQNAVEQAKENFTENFINEYKASYIDNNYWENMKPTTPAV